MGSYRGSRILFAIAYVVVMLGLFLALGGLAYAASPTSAGDQYGTKVEGVHVSSTAKTSTEAASAAQSQALPNTGLSLLGVVAVGGALVAGGLALRRRERGKS